MKRMTLDEMTIARCGGVLRYRSRKQQRKQTPYAIVMPAYLRRIRIKRAKRKFSELQRGSTALPNQKLICSFYDTIREARSLDFHTDKAHISGYWLPMQSNLPAARIQLAPPILFVRIPRDLAAISRLFTDLSIPTVITQMIASYMTGEIYYDTLSSLLQPHRVKQHPPHTEDEFLHLSSTKGGYFCFGAYNQERLLDVCRLSMSCHSSLNYLSEISSTKLNALAFDFEFYHRHLVIDPLEIGKDDGYSLAGYLQRMVNRWCKRVMIPCPLNEDHLKMAITSACGWDNVKQAQKSSYTFHFPHLAMTPRDCQALTKLVNQEMNGMFMLPDFQRFDQDPCIFDPSVHTTRHGCRLLWNDKMGKEKPAGRPKLPFAIVLGDGQIVTDQAYPWEDFVRMTFRFRIPSQMNEEELFVLRTNTEVWPPDPDDIPPAFRVLSRSVHIDETTISHPSSVNMELLHCLKDIPLHWKQQIDALRVKKVVPSDQSTSKYSLHGNKSKSFPVSRGTSPLISTKSEPVNISNSSSRSRLPSSVYVQPLTPKQLQENKENKSHDFNQFFQEVGLHVPATAPAPPINSLQSILLRWAHNCRNRLGEVILTDEVTYNSRRFQAVNAFLVTSPLGPLSKVQDARAFYSKGGNVPSIEMGMFNTRANNCYCVDDSKRDKVTGRPRVHGSNRSCVRITPRITYMSCFDLECKNKSKQINTPVEISQLFFLEVRDLL